MTDAELLIGRWIMTGDDVRTAEFHANGTMKYTISFGARSLVVDLTWRIEGRELVSQPNDVRSRYELPDPDTLVLTYEGAAFRYRRVGI